MDWVVRIPECLVEVYSRPADGLPTFRHAIRFKPNDAIRLALDGDATEFGLVGVRTILEDSHEPNEKGAVP